jgi:class 3 adenylate cyclase
MSESGGDLASLRAEVDRLRTLVEAQQATLDGLARRLGVTIATEAGDSEDDQLWRRLGLTEGERRIVTILFADVSGFTALGERLDPEEVQLVMRDTMGGLARCVQAEAGHVEKFIGDAVCAIFGAPMAHEDEPERAVRTALAMHATVADLARRRPDLPALAVHIGLNTGIVVAGTVGDGS